MKYSGSYFGATARRRLQAVHTPDRMTRVANTLGSTYAENKGGKDKRMAVGSGVAVHHGQQK